MGRLLVFNSVSLDGFFTGVNGDLSWAHRSDPEIEAFTAENARGGGILLFGRKTYELMESYWPTPIAKQNDPVVADRMNNGQKVVFSRTLAKASWSNTKLVKGDIAAEVRKMKKESGPDMVLMGSGTIVSHFAQEGLIDEYQFMLVPVVLGKGRTLFEGVSNRFSLKQTRTRAFGNGTVLLCYQPT